MGLGHSLLKQAYLTIILLGFGRKSCWSLSRQVKCSTPLQLPHTVAHTALMQQMSTGQLVTAGEVGFPPPWCLEQMVAWRQDKRSKGTSCNKDVLWSWNLLEVSCYRSCASYGHRNRDTKKMRASAVEDCFHGGLNSFPTPAIQFSWTWCKLLTACHSRSAIVWFLCLCPNAQSLHHCSWELWSELAKCFKRCKVIWKTAGYKQLHMNAQKQWAFMRLISLLLSCKNNEQY